MIIRVRRLRKRTCYAALLLAFFAGHQMLRHQKEQLKLASNETLRSRSIMVKSEEVVTSTQNNNEVEHPPPPPTTTTTTTGKELDAKTEVRRQDGHTDDPLAELRNFAVPTTGSWAMMANTTCIYDNGGGDAEKDEPIYPWQRRAPYAIILGVHKGGTQALNEYVTSHPLVVRRQGWVEEHFFGVGKYSSFHWDQANGGISATSNRRAYAERIQKNYPDFWINDNSTSTTPTKAHPDLITVDDTPGYILHSDSIPHQIACVAPWAKLLVVLRNPVDRLKSHYRFEFGRKPERQRKAWEDWISRDLDALREAGVLQDWNKVDFNTFSGSDLETLAWKRYLRGFDKRGYGYPVARSLYAIQVQHYFASLERRGKDPKTEMHVILSEDMKRDIRGVVSGVFDFLDLPQHALDENTAEEKHKTSQGRSVPMPESVEKELKQLFAPYNQRLFDLLGRENVWD